MSTRRSCLGLEPGDFTDNRNGYAGERESAKVREREKEREISHVYFQFTERNYILRGALCGGQRRACEENLVS